MNQFQNLFTVILFLFISGIPAAAAAAYAAYAAGRSYSAAAATGGYPGGFGLPPTHAGLAAAAAAAAAAGYPTPAATSAGREPISNNRIVFFPLRASCLHDRVVKGAKKYDHCINTEGD